MEMWLNFIVSVLSGLAVCIPLVVKLVVAVKDVIKEKNWSELCKIAMQFMISAEGNFADGADKKEWVMDAVADAAQSINYNYDEAARAKMSDMIDAMVGLSKELNKK